MIYRKDCQRPASSVLKSSDEGRTFHRDPPAGLHYLRFEGQFRRGVALLIPLRKTL